MTYEPYDARTAMNRVVVTLGMIWRINRFDGLLGLNIGYLLIILALSRSPAVVWEQLPLVGVFFGAVLLMKAQASVADALHDYSADSENPHKSHVANRVDEVGESYAMVLLVGQFGLSLVLWWVLTWVTGDPFFFIVGAVSNFLGFTYSYPPRFKEWGFVNHVVTSSVDVFCVVVPGTLLLVDDIGLLEIGVFSIVFIYSFAYHIMHQAGDTYYDRMSGMETFTQKLGVSDSVFASLVLGAAAVFSAFCLGLFVVGAGVAAFATHLYRIYDKIIGKNERNQSDIVSNQFRIAIWATGLNVLTAFNVLVVRFVL